jgi:capsular polysaccharide biosynthesis protein
MSVPTLNRVSRYLTVIIRWLTITVIVFVLTILGGAYITDHFLHKIYTARAQIEVKTEAGSKPDASDFQSEFEVMESPDFLLPVIYDLGLDKEWAGRDNKPASDVLPHPDALLPEDALAYMHKIVKLDLLRGTNIITITVSSDVPKEAADIANAVADRYKILRDAGKLQKSPVRIISRAEPPEQSANAPFTFLVTMLVAGFLSLAVASFVEIVLLISRASERTDN